jgi:hypothetical protein
MKVPRQPMVSVSARSSKLARSVASEISEMTRRAAAT